MVSVVLPPQLRRERAEMLRSGEYSDMTLVLGEEGQTKVKVHKSFICPHSKVFAAIFNGTWKESQTGEIHLPDDEPSAIMRMLAFLYTGEYDDDDETEAQNNDKDHFVKRMINQAAVYGIADKYDIQDLKTLAHRSFILLGCGIIPEKFMDLSEVVDTVYNSTPASDRNLRDIVVSICKYRTEFHLAQASFQEMSQRNAQFSFDLLCAVQKDVVKAKAEWTADAQKMRKTIDDLRAEESKLQREIVNQGKLMNRVQDLVDFGYALPAGFLDFDD